MYQMRRQSLPTKCVSRRRFLSISAAASGVALFAGGTSGSTVARSYRWRGLALGAEADLTLYAANRAEAMEAISASLEEIARLEAIFSLYQSDSALAKLNEAGFLDEPPQELVELLSEAQNLSRRSNGLFDPTIQPLWEAVAAHFSSNPLSEPDPARFQAAQSLVDYRLLSISPGSVRLGRPGMRVTLNGIAQGYISDKVAALLKERGFVHALVNLGEAVATGPTPLGGVWELSVPNPLDRSEILARIPLTGGAVATSSGAGLVFDREGRFTHIMHPQRVMGAPMDRSVTVLAPSASLADGLSTLAALAAPGSADIEAIVREVGARALIISHAEREQRWLG